MWPCGANNKPLYSDEQEGGEGAAAGEDSHSSISLKELKGGEGGLTTACLLNTSCSSAELQRR